MKTNYSKRLGDCLLELSSPTVKFVSFTWFLKISPISSDKGNQAYKRSMCVIFLIIWVRSVNCRSHGEFFLATNITSKSFRFCSVERTVKWSNKLETLSCSYLVSPVTEWKINNFRRCRRSRVRILFQISIGWCWLRFILLSTSNDNDCIRLHVDPKLRENKSRLKKLNQPQKIPGVINIETMLIWILFNHSIYFWSVNYRIISSTSQINVQISLIKSIGSSKIFINCVYVQ